MPKLKGDPLLSDVRGIGGNYPVIEAQEPPNQQTTKPDDTSPKERGPQWDYEVADDDAGGSAIVSR